MQASTSVFASYEGLSARGACLASSPAPASTRGAPVRAFCVEAKQLNKRDRTERAHKRVRNKVSGTPERPRLAVFRSNNHIYAQVIDDEAGHTLAAASTLSKGVEVSFGGNKEAAAAVGKAVAEACLAKDISKVCFDRGGHIYHGRIAALAEAAREAGLSF